MVSRYSRPNFIKPKHLTYSGGLMGLKRASNSLPFWHAFFSTVAGAMSANA